MEAWRLEQVAWQDRVNPVTGAGYRSARVMRAEGMEAIYVRYPPGSVTPDHSHPCGHVMVVLRGQLQTQDGVFGPGDLVWYGAGEIGSHGATALEEVTALILSAGAFEVKYRFTG